MPNRAIEVHDSILASVSIVQGRVDLTFSSVYIHQSEGRPGIDAGSGWVKKAILRIDDAKVTGAFSEFPVDLGGGQIQMGANRSDNEIPLPLRYRGAFEVRLEAMWRAEEVCFSDSGAELELLGEPEYVEEFRP